jgi:hypothetical protein
MGGLDGSSLRLVSAIDLGGIFMGYTASLVVRRMVCCCDFFFFFESFGKVHSLLTPYLYVKTISSGDEKCAN